MIAAGSGEADASVTAAQPTGGSGAEAGLPPGAANCDPMPDSTPTGQQWPGRLIAKRVEKKGLRPRLAAAVIAVLWLAAIVIFGIAEHLIDPQSFDDVWDGMWWATQTVTTVGYGDVVPDSGAGRVIAAVLMIGGLSLFAVVTGVITSTFVAAARTRKLSEADDPVLAKMTEIETQLSAIKADVARLSAGPDRSAGP
jgi:voltage-gated potassium channel